MKVKDLKINPNNPQRFDDLSKLENSIRDFPKMMKLRPLVYDPKTMIVLGGNKRLLAIQNLGLKEIPDEWVRPADELTEEEKKRFIIADNVGFGEWDWEILESDYEQEDLEEWGLDPFEEKEQKEQTINIQPYEKAHILISYDIDLHDSILEIIERISKINGVEIEKSAN